MPETKKPEDEDVTEGTDETTETDGKQTGTDQAKTEKTFTQTEVDRLVQQRLRREKEASKTTIDTLSADVTFYEEQMTKVVEAQTADWDEGMKTLFNALPVKERLQKLSDEAFMATMRRKNIPPKTPKEEGQGTVTFKHKISRI